MATCQPARTGFRVRKDWLNGRGAQRESGDERPRRKLSLRLYKSDIGMKRAPGATDVRSNGGLGELDGLEYDARPDEDLIRTEAFLSADLRAQASGLWRTQISKKLFCRKLPSGGQPTRPLACSGCKLLYIGRK